MAVSFRLFFSSVNTEGGVSMRQLVNVSNTGYDQKMFNALPRGLEGFLREQSLDGVEMFLYGDWDGCQAKGEIDGVHLRFWPYWLDFWRGEKELVRQELGTKDKIDQVFGAETPEAWLEIWKDNIRQAVKTGARYLVLHVSDAAPSELYTWRFHVSDEEVIRGTMELVNALDEVLPEGLLLLFENLWWPGLRLDNPALLETLLTGVKHQKCGVMLDTGHLMNTNQCLGNEADGFRYVLQKVGQLGCLKQVIKGIHLSTSLSGAYVRKTLAASAPASLSIEQIMRHVALIDQHRPCCEQRLVESLLAQIEPAWVVHEFIYSSAEEWTQKVSQQAALVHKWRVAI